jgi:hypothetical protein
VAKTLYTAWAPRYTLREMLGHFWDTVELFTNVSDGRMYLHHNHDGWYRCDSKYTGSYMLFSLYPQPDNTINVTFGQRRFCFRKLDTTEVDILRLFAD